MAVPLSRKIREAARAVSDARRRLHFENLAEEVALGGPSGVTAYEASLLFHYAALARVRHERLSRLCTEKVGEAACRRSLRHMIIGWAVLEEYSQSLSHAHRLGAVHTELTRGRPPPSSLYAVEDEVPDEAGAETDIDDPLPAEHILAAARDVAARKALSSGQETAVGDTLRALLVDVAAHPLGYAPGQHCELLRLCVQPEMLRIVFSGARTGALVAAHERLCATYSDSGFAVLFTAMEAATVLQGVQYMRLQLPDPGKTAPRALAAARRLVDAAFTGRDTVPAARALHLYLRLCQESGGAGAVPTPPHVLDVSRYVTRLRVEVQKRIAQDEAAGGGEEAAGLGGEESARLVNVAAYLFPLADSVVGPAPGLARHLRAEAMFLTSAVNPSALALPILCRAAHVHIRNRSDPSAAAATAAAMVAQVEALPAMAPELCLDVFAVLQRCFQYHPPVLFTQADGVRVCRPLLAHLDGAMKEYIARAHPMKLGAALGAVVHMAQATRLPLPSAVASGVAGQLRPPLTAAVTTLEYVWKMDHDGDGLPRAAPRQVAAGVRHSPRRVQRATAVIALSSLVRVARRFGVTEWDADGVWDAGAAMLRVLHPFHRGAKADIPAMHAAVLWVRTCLAAGKPPPEHTVAALGAQAKGHMPLPPTVVCDLVSVVTRGEDYFGRGAVLDLAERLAAPSMYATFTAWHCAALMQTFAGASGIGTEGFTLGAAAAMEPRVLHLLQSDDAVVAPSTLAALLTSVAALQCMKSAVPMAVKRVLSACVKDQITATAAREVVEALCTLRVHGRAAAQVAASPSLQERFGVEDAASVLYHCAVLQTADTRLWESLGSRLLAKAETLPLRPALRTLLAARASKAEHPEFMARLRARFHALKTSHADAYRRLRPQQRRCVDDFVASGPAAAAPVPSPVLT